MSLMILSWAGSVFSYFEYQPQKIIFAIHMLHFMRLPDIRFLVFYTNFSLYTLVFKNHYLSSFLQKYSCSQYSFWMNINKKSSKKARTVTTACVPQGWNDIRFGEANRISQILPALDKEIFHCIGGVDLELLSALKCYILS